MSTQRFHEEGEQLHLGKLAILIRSRRRILVTAGVVTGLCLGTAFIGPRTYTSSATFRPQASSSTLGLFSDARSLAGRLGIDLAAGGGGAESPDFFLTVLTSDEVLKQTASASYFVPGQGAASLSDLLEINEKTPELTLDETMRWLDEAVGLELYLRANAVTITVKTPWREVSRAIAEKLLEEVKRYNVEVRQSQARLERIFVEERVNLALGEMQAWEDSLQNFLAGNRLFGEYSSLRFHHDRLQEEVALHRSVYATLKNSFEQAQILEVRDTPIINIVQSPFLPRRPDSLRLLIRIAIGLFLGCTMGIVYAFAKDALQRSKRDPDPGANAFQEAWSDFAASFPFRRAASSAKPGHRSSPSPG